MEWIPRAITNHNWITLLILICILLLTIVKVRHPIGFSDFMLLMTTDKYFITHQKTNRVSGFFTAILIIVQAITVGLLGYLCARTFEWELNSTGLLLFFQIFVGYLVFVYAKLLIDKIIATIFSMEERIEKYQFYKITYRNFIGVVLLPVVVLCVYAYTPTVVLFYGILSVVGVFNLIIILSFFKKNQKIIIGNLYYFILYLCALEIAPYFILYKVLT